jgi:hypothetical protein
MNELHEKCKRNAEYVRLYRQRKKADTSSVDERIRNAERVRLHRKRFYIFDRTTERGITERCSVILHHIHYSCRLKFFFSHLRKVQTGSGAHPFASQSTDGFYRRVNGPECETDRTETFSAEFKNAWSCTSTSPSAP